MSGYARHKVLINAHQMFFFFFFGHSTVGQPKYLMRVAMRTTPQKRRYMTLGWKRSVCTMKHFTLAQMHVIFLVFRHSFFQLFKDVVCVLIWILSVVTLNLLTWLLLMLYNWTIPYCGMCRYHSACVNSLCQVYLSCTTQYFHQLFTTYLYGYVHRMQKNIQLK